MAACYPPPQHTRREKWIKRLRHVAIVVSASAVLVAMLLAVVAGRSPDTAIAATQVSPAQMGTIAGGPPSSQQIALDNQKQQLAHEYMQVLQGKESLSLFEQHTMALMKQRGISYYARLPQVMAHIKLARQGCPSVSGMIGCPPPPGGVQFPEHPSYFCGPAAASTILVTDSFSWGGAVITNNGNQLIYDTKVVSQPSSDYDTDENLLAQQHYLDTISGGTNFGPMLATLNDFVGGNGGWYNEVWSGNQDNNHNSNHDVADNFENDLVTDSSEGWAFAGGLNITGNSWDASLQGYPNGVAFKHWISLVGYSNGGATTFYADPVYNSPDYNWAVPGPIASTSTSQMIDVLASMGYFW